MVVRKHVTRLHGEYGRALYLLSIVTSDASEQGTGTAMMEACRQLCRAGMPASAECHVFAQCVKLKFWTDLADVSMEAKTLNYQMLLVDAEHGRHYADCVPRSVRCRAESNPLASPSREDDA